MWFDSHAHITSLDEEQREPVLQRAHEASVTHIMNICTQSDELLPAQNLKEKYPHLYLAGSTTPHDVEKLGELDYLFFEKAAEQGHLQAIGETGLDYHYEHSPKELQREFFVRYMDLALTYRLPLVIHCRDAFDDLIELLKQEYIAKSGAQHVILHCFTGNLSEARRLLDLHCYLSFSGIVTFKKSESLREVAAFTPADAMLIETDTPYLAPQTKRGKQNEPAFVVETGELLSTIKEIPKEVFAKQTTDNTFKAFGILDI